MNKKIIIGLSAVIIIFLVILGIRSLSGEDNWICQDGQWIRHGQPSSPKPTTGCNDNIYRNTQYGFSFSLPTSWQGYSILNDNWKGNLVNAQVNQTVTGPEILIRHPLWTSKDPRQDIPVMIFTLAQWDLIQQEKLSLGAAPVGPSEFGRNTKYVFALPARYNYAFPTGFKEVEKIIENKPFQAF